MNKLEFVPENDLLTQEKQRSGMKLVNLSVDIISASGVSEHTLFSAFLNHILRDKQICLYLSDLSRKQRRKAKLN